VLAFVAGVAAPTTFTEVLSVWAIGQDAATLTTMPTSAVPKTRSAGEAVALWPRREARR
jgi:hypothetical protein